MKTLRESMIYLERHLSSLESKVLSETPSRDTMLNIEESHRYKITMSEKNRACKILLHTFVGPKPSSLFEIRMTHEITVRFDREVSVEELERELDFFVQPLGKDISYVCTIVCFEMIKDRIILPPSIDIKMVKPL